MECNISDIPEFNEVLGRIGHHVVRAGQMALFCDVDALGSACDKEKIILFDVESFRKEVDAIISMLKSLIP